MHQDIYSDILWDQSTELILSGKVKKGKNLSFMHHRSEHAGNTVHR
jgi:hypothetical protein